MSVEHSPSKSFSLFWFKPSHRTWPEQVVGAFIFLLVSFTFEWLSGWFIYDALQAESMHGIFSSHWAFPFVVSRLAWRLYYFLSAFSMWNLWRRYSLKTLKLELAAFLVQFLLLIGWSLSFFVLHESLLALLSLLFFCSNVIFASLLFWQKERFSGQVIILTLFWIFYVVGVNMTICISTP